MTTKTDAPALWLWRAKPAFAYAILGTRPHFPCPPALWLWRAKPAFAYAILGTYLHGNPGRVRSALRPHTRHPHPARCARALALGLAIPKCKTGGLPTRLGPLQLGEHGPFFFGQRAPLDQVRTAR